MSSPVIQAHTLPFSGDVHFVSSSWTRSQIATSSIGAAKRPIIPFFSSQRTYFMVSKSVPVLDFGVIFLKRYKSKNCISNAPNACRDLERESYINSILYGGEQHCINQIRMRPAAFFKLCDVLTRNGFLSSSRSVPVREQVMMFLLLLGHDVRLRVVGSRFFRSIETVHQYFLIVLQAILKLHEQIIRLPDDSIPPKIRNTQQFYPHFKYCVGALDGTHIRCTVPSEIQGRFRGRKDRTTQNVLAIVTLDLKFAYVLAGWEGSAHDSCVLNDALLRPRGLRIPEGKYYLGDAGYGIRNGIISPYHGVRYHLKEFSDHPPQNEKELFNLRHAKLRNRVERSFGVLKKRFCILDDSVISWSFDTQVKIVLSCCILHNFIIGVEDPINQEPIDESSDYARSRASYTQHEEREEIREWMAKRDEIARAMWDDYLSRRRM